MVLAQEAAQRLRNNAIAPEHILLGIVEEGNNIAVDALASFGFTAQHLRGVAERNLQGAERVSQEMVFTPSAKRLIEWAFEESRELNNNYIGIEHLMLAYTRIEPPERSLLSYLGIDRAALRDKLLELLPKLRQRQSAAPAGQSERASRTDLLSTLYAHISSLDRAGVESAVEQSSGKRLYYLDTEDLWKRLQACVARRDIVGSIMYALVIDHREEHTPEETAREVFKRMHDNYSGA
jgi:ATP-dependent Clp protease ATP-binding subunit ClpC